MTTNLIINYITLFNSTVIATHNMLKFIVDYGVKYNNYSNLKLKEFANLQKELKNTSLVYKLNLVTMLIKHVLQSRSLLNNTKDTINDCITDNKIDDKIDNSLVTTINVTTEYEIIEVKNVLFDLPQDSLLRYALLNVIETIHVIHQILNDIHVKIKKYDEAYLKYFMTIDVSNEYENVKDYNKIFDTQIHYLLEMMKLYNIQLHI